MLYRSQVQRRNGEVEAAKLRELRLEDVELSAAGELRCRAAVLRVAPRHVRFVDDEMRQRTTGPTRVAEELSLPIDRERCASQRAQEIEIHRRRSKIDVANREYRATDDERHRSHQARLRAPHV